MQWPPLTGTLVPHEGRAGNRSVKRQSLSELLSTDPIDWQWATHPRLIFLRSQCFMSELPPCRGAMNKKDLGLFGVDVVY